MVGGDVGYDFLNIFKENILCGRLLTMRSYVDTTINNFYFS